MQPLQGIYGGTFDPIHLGHVETVSSVLAQTNLVTIRFVPAATPPHRPVPGTSARDRLAMTRIAVQHEPRFVVDDRELHRCQPSFTSDTIRSLMMENPDSRYSLILGLDAALGFDRWHEYQWLLDHVHLIVMARPGWSVPDSLPLWWREREVEEFAALEVAKAGKLWRVRINPVDISATRIRQALKHGEDIRQWLHNGVFEYIRENRLYE